MEARQSNAAEGFKSLISALNSGTWEIEIHLNGVTNPPYRELFPRQMKDYYKP
jgi:hypothetical protein